MEESWLPTLMTDNPQAGYDLAVKLSRMSIKAIQPDADVRAALRTVYEHDASALIASSQTIAQNFNTVAAANNYWK
ncbi:hexameric tyrosine-coordinated heme protein [Pseudovibrio sp. Tun.PSC04-5.I4]|uniref:hexameric tyrosine-coordinated heme protein n=1 Tax=Pseudovibrio sp. Tun.PSC04-5.I4 TaxID=1798213 RepID=UPI00087FF27B|nr:hexameric tyrosine-coordinated heme protein [Pseudovibrio sp. Tun.PSC04-5.I4]SDR47520.1 Hexameric tyrosine-coordinated heme protein (HTHP) [Pseudovibrio sp. Tun.PSC04-5.I4]